MNNKTSPVQILNCGVYDSRLIYKNTDITKKRTVSVFELELPLENEGVSFINTEVYKVKKENFIISKPGDTRKTRLHYRCFYIHLIAEHGNIFEVLSSMPSIIRIYDYEAYASVFGMLISACDNPADTNSFMVLSRLYELLYMLKRDSASTSQIGSGKNYSVVIKKSIDFINENLDSDITLEDVANNAHMSRIYFHKVFKEAVGQTVHRYLTTKRIEEVKKRLLTSNESAGEIALKFGFSSQSYFNYIFKKETGFTPVEYKKKNSIQYTIQK